MKRMFFVLLSVWNVVSQDVQVCPDDWFDASFLGCFKFLDSSVELSWVEAQFECEKAGGYLAEPKTERQAKFLYEIAELEESLTGIRFWYIGLTDSGREGDWIWKHHDEAITYNAWSTNHPNNRTMNKDDCAVMVLKKGQVSWEDHNCDRKRNKVFPVCQRDTDQSEPETTTEMQETTAALSCPEHWTEFNRSCYKFFPSSEYWYTAHTICQGEGGHLASVHSAEEDSILQSLASGNSFWIGGYYIGQVGWVWSDWSDFDYSNMLDASFLGCLYQGDSNYGSGWSSGYCDDYDSNAYICQQDSSASETQTTTVVPDSTPALQCPKHWSSFNGGCYKLFDSFETWDAAENICQGEGGQLTSVHSEEEDSFLQSIATGSSFWIGGYPNNEGDWVWSDGSDFDYINSYDANTGCLYQSYGHYNFGWSSALCDTYYYKTFICKLF